MGGGRGVGMGTGSGERVLCEVNQAVSPCLCKDHTRRGCAGLGRPRDRPNRRGGRPRGRQNLPSSRCWSPGEWGQGVVGAGVGAPERQVATCYLFHWVWGWPAGSAGWARAPKHAAKQATRGFWYRRHRRRRLPLLHSSLPFVSLRTGPWPPALAHPFSRVHAARSLKLQPGRRRRRQHGLVGRAGSRGPRMRGAPARARAASHRSRHPGSPLAAGAA